MDSVHAVCGVIYSTGMLPSLPWLIRAKQLRPCKLSRNLIGTKLHLADSTRTLTITSIGGIHLRSYYALEKVFTMYKASSLKDSHGALVLDFEALQHGGTYDLVDKQREELSPPKDLIYDPSRFPKGVEFPRDGFGPFIVEREDFVNSVLDEASPDCAVHISGCKGSGKTVLLKLIRNKLLQAGETVYYIQTASRLCDTDCREFDNSQVVYHQKPDSEWIRDSICPLARPMETRMCCKS